MNKSPLLPLVCNNAHTGISGHFPFSIRDLFSIKREGLIYQERKNIVSFERFR
jgi:hypothetical protein